MATKVLVATTVKSDAELEQLARSGNVDAFGQLLRRWDLDLRSVVWSVLRQRTGTDDVLQMAYEKAWKSLGGFRGDAALKTWIHAICYRAAIDHVRYESRRVHAPAELLEILPASNSTSRDAISRAELAATLAKIEPDARALLMLTAGLGYSFDEAAEIAGLPRGTVATKVRRARLTLQQQRDQEDVV